MNLLWRSGEELRDNLTSVFNRAKSGLLVVLHNYRHEDVGQQLNNLDLRLQSLIDQLGEVDRFRERDQEELLSIVERVTKDMQLRFAREKDLIFDFMENVLTAQLEEENAASAESLNPDLDKLTQQFQVIMDKSIENRIDVLEGEIARKFEDFSAKITGQIQNFALGLLNSINQVIDMIERCMAEHRNNPELVSDLAQNISILEQGREETNKLLLSLAWQDLMVDRCWQEILDAMKTNEPPILAGLNPEIKAKINEVLEKQITGLNEMIKDTLYQGAIDKIIIAEFLQLLYEEGELPPSIPDGTFVLFEYVAALEEMAQRIIMLPMNRLKQAVFLKEEVKAGAFNYVFQSMVDSLTTRNPGFESYLKDSYPRQFLAFLHSTYLRPRPTSCGNAAWMIFLLLIDDAQSNRNTDPAVVYLTALLLAAHNIRNRYIHPTRGSQYVKLEDKKRLDEIRTITLQGFDLLGRVRQSPAEDQPA